MDAPGVLLLRSWLLLLLADGPRHGYQLTDDLPAQAGVSATGSYVYRTLRSLEEAGALRSHWEISGSGGPPRRVYVLTVAGQAALDDAARALAALGRRLRRFEAYYRRAGASAAPATASDAVGSRRRRAGPG